MDEVDFEVSDEEGSICCICFAQLEDGDAYTLSECNHTFHTTCIMKWFRSKNDSCPLCREQPALKLKPPDIFHRAKALMEKERTGATSDPFVQNKMLEIIEAERMEAVHLKDLMNQKEMYIRTVKPQKESIIKRYRLLKKQFKDSSSHLLRQLDDIDEKESAQRRQITRLLHSEKKKKREAMRDIGIHNIEPLSNQPRQH